MKKLVFATMMTAGLLAFGDDVATLESNLKSDIMSKVNQVNPIDSATGQRKYISFAMISDIHKCKRVPGDDAATNPVKTYWYGSAGCLTEAEQSIRLLGSLAVDAGLDAVINGGDLSTAPIMGDAGRLTVDEYTNEIWNVKALFNQHLPASVPLFTVDGNHDRHYEANSVNYGMVESDSDWGYILTNFNTSASVAHEHGVDITYHRDLAKAKLGDNQTGRFTGNSYHLDFRRLYATKGYNVRIACVSFYDTSTGCNTEYRAHDAAQFYDPDTGLPFDATKTPENTIMGMVSHDGQNLGSRKPMTTAGTLQWGFMNGPWNLDTHKGRAFFGLVAAHQHFAHVATIKDAFDTQANPGNDVYASAVQVSSAYAVNYPAKPNQHQLGTDQAYHFSIFVIDTENNLLHEVRVGGVNNANVHEVPVVQLYNTNIRTHLDQSAQTAPTLGTVTVTPAVTNATLSGAISSLGSGATACDVYLACGTSANNLGAATKIAEGVTASFGYVISNLTAETTYYYSLSVSNNAETVMGAAKSGNFTTGAEAVEPGPEPEPGEVILPGATASATRETIQAAIDAAAILSPAGTVVLSNGLFEIDAQLMVTGGVTLVGQGWDKTVVKQVAQTPAANTRVMTIEGGATVKYLTMTGGRLNNANALGGGAFITDGTVSWCCITNNSSRTHHGGGIGVYGKGSVKIDHAVIAGNTVGTAYPDGVGGGIGVRGQSGLQVEIDSCLVYGNVAGASGRTSHGGGIGIIGKAATDHYTTIIRNTTVANNQTVGNGLGGGFYTDQSQTTLANCIFADNTSESGDGNVVLSSDTVSNAVALLTSNCLFGNGTVAFGSSAVGVAGSAGFVSAENGDYHLSSGSPAIGAGATYAGIGNDLDDKAFGATPSIGCYEADGSTPPAPQHEHTWGAATYVWSAGNATCTGSAACTSDSTHVTNETVAATYDVIQAATTEAAGTGRYTAVFSGAPFETQTKDVTIPKLPPEPQPGEGIQPGETASATRQTIQEAIDDAAPTHGTVTLGNGLFEIDAQLMVTGGVTLVGQGWENTVINFAGTKSGSENRVVNISDGSVVSHVTLTGGKVDNNDKSGGGAFVTDGTISWCCITNNYAKRSYGGGGVFVSGEGSVKIDHTIVADNSAGTAFLNGVGGGIGIRGRSGLQVEIDTCLVYGNVAGASDRTSHGGGIAVTGVDSSDHFTTVICNTTIADNSVVGSGLGGGLYIDQSDTTLINCIVSGNTSEAAATTGDADVAYKDATIASAVGTKTTTCLFGGTPLFVDAANGDYRLAENSPAIEAGTAYEGIGKDLADKYFSYTKPAIGCYEYGDYDPPPAGEWDIPGASGGINGLDDGNGGKCIAFTSVVRNGETLVVGIEAAKINANGQTFGLVCKDNLDDVDTFVLNAVLTDDGSGSATVATLQTTTDKTQLFVFGICEAVTE